jgi:ATP-dependent helicase/nuclease subunit B
VDPFIDQLASLCRAHPTRSKWVFVPTHAVGRTIGERIALEGTNWLNLRFVTPLDIALRMGAPFLVERGIEPSEEGLGPALIMRLLLDMPVDGGYFRPLADQPTMAQALWAAIRELRMAGMKSEDLETEAFESAVKHAELRELLAAYELFLTANQRGDMAAVYEEALRHPDWCPIQPEDCWTELPDVVWTVLQRRLIDAMPGERIVPSTFRLSTSALPRRLENAVVDRVEADSGSSPLASLLDPSASAGSPAAIHLFHAGGREAEIEEVFRRILSSGAPLDHVEIGCASDEHVALVWEKALRHEWGVTLGPGIPAAQTRPGRALIGICDWIETDFSAGHLRRLLQSGDMGVETDDEGFSEGQAARILARAEAGWGRETYRLSLTRLRKEYQSRATDNDASTDDREYAKGRAELTKRVHDWIAGILDAIPVSDAEGDVPLQDVVDAMLDYARRTTARKSLLDHRAGDAIVEFIGELRALGSFSCTLSEALRFIRERIQSLRVAPERPRPGHLHVSRLTQPSYCGRPHLYAVGLEEGRVFPTASEDPVLLDRERAAISPALRLSTDRIDEAVYGVLRRLATWGGVKPSDGAGRTAASVTLSYSCRDTREFRETYASWLMLQAFRLQQKSPAATYPDMKSALGEPKSIVAADRRHASSSGAWWLRTVLGSADEGATRVAAAFAGVERGRKALAARSSDLFSEFDGYVPGAGSVLDPCAASASLSVTSLESAAACPFRFFLSRGLGLRPVDDGARDRDVWLDPLTRGSELHDIYAALLRRCRAEDRRPDRKKDWAWLQRLTMKHLADLEREMPPATSEILDRESREFLGDVELFFEAECENRHTTAVGLEVSFGRPLGDDEEPLARAEAIEIDLGGGLTFRIAGRIDRIDQVGSNAFEVLDYKTGGYWRDSWTGVFNGGRRLQHALYGLAAVELLRAQYKNPKVTGGVYYFSSRRGRGERVRIPAPGERAIAKVLQDLRTLIVDGVFAHARTQEDCSFCDFAVGCDGTLQHRAEPKLGDRKLVAFGRLGEHA